MTPATHVYGEWGYEVRRVCPTCGAHLKLHEIQTHEKGSCGVTNIVRYPAVIYLICPACNAEHLYGSPGTDEDICLSCGCIMEDW